MFEHKSFITVHISQVAFIFSVASDDDDDDDDVDDDDDELFLWYG